MICGSPAWRRDSGDENWFQQKGGNGIGLFGMGNLPIPAAGSPPVGILAEVSAITALACRWRIGPRSMIPN